MRRRRVTVEAVSSGSAADVFAALCDRDAVVAWSPMSECALESPGDPDAEGVGAVRRQRMGRRVGYDSIVELVPGRLFRYTHRGLPVSGYVGTVEMDDVDDGCRIRWSCEFTPTIPLTGKALESGIGRFLTECVTGLAEYASTARRRVD